MDDITIALICTVVAFLFIGVIAFIQKLKKFN